MTKSAPAFWCACLLLCLSFSAQQPLTANSLDSLNRSQPDFPALSLENAEPFSFPSTFAWVDATSPPFFPSLPQPAAAHRTVAAGAGARDSSKQVVDLPKTNLLDDVHGEIGVLYGHSVGKFDGDVESGYILGQVGDDKLQISIGGAYQRWSGRVRFGH